MDRRDALKLLLAATGAPLVQACGRAAEALGPSSAPAAAPGAPRTKADDTMAEESKQKEVMPAIFLAHGAPMLVDDAQWSAELSSWARAMPRPSSILMISAHWVDRPVTLGATATVPLVYDFYGFPQRYYEVKYPSPGAPELAARVRGLLSDAREPVAESPGRGLDHGAYVPLLPMYPKADVPVLQISIPTMDPATLVALGRRLAPLREEGVLLVGSGFLTHNLREMSLRSNPAPPSWATDFDQWCGEALAKRDVDLLVQYREKAPGVRMSLPTHEHFVPVLVALGASLDRAEPVSFPIGGWVFGSGSKRSVQFG